MNYPVACQSCPAAAAYKVAAEWSDGQTRELKTYGLACPACVKATFAMAKAKRAACRLLPGETLSAPGIYAMNRGTRDQKLERKPELETEF